MPEVTTQEDVNRMVLHACTKDIGEKWAQNRSFAVKKAVWNSEEQEENFEIIFYDEVLREYSESTGDTIITDFEELKQLAQEEKCRNAVVAQPAIRYAEAFFASQSPN